MVRWSPARTRLSMLALIGLLVLGFSVHADDDDDGTPLFRYSGAAPLGFEALARSQTALVDVYYGDRPLLSTMATYTPETITFNQPEELLVAIPDLKDVESVRAALIGALDSNTEKVCRSSNRDCGALSPEVAGVIFSEERYRVDLFVNGTLRSVGAPPRRKFLPSAESGYSFIQNFSGNFAGSNSGEDNATINSFSTFAHDENRLVAIASYSTQDDVTIDQLFGRRDFEGRQYIGGLFRTSGRALTFAGENDLLGVRMASTLDTRADLRFSRGTPIDVFLVSRARVDVIKDGRLISTRFYEAGNQILDTSSLPEGAYDITVRITEGGQVREETQFFTKTSRIPPKDQPLFTLEAGEVMLRNTGSVFPEDAGAFVVRVGYSRRLTDTFGFDSGVAGTSDDQLLELGLFQIDTLPGMRDAYYEFQASVFGSAAGDMGFAFNGLLRYNRVSLNFDYRDVNRKDAPLTGEDPGFSLIPDDLSQYSVSLQFPIGPGSMGVGASDNRRRGTESRESQSINFRYPLLNTRNGFLEMRGDVSRTNGNYAAFIGLRFNFWRNQWSGNLLPSYQHADEDLGLDDGFRVDGTATWHDPDSAVGDLRFSANGGVGENVNQIGSSVDVQNFLGRTVASINHVDRDGNATTAYSATINTGALTDGETWTFGGQNGMDSALVIDLEGEAQDTDFEVLIDGFRRGYAPAGRSTAIQLPPFRTYEVRISPRRANFVAFRDRIEEVTLYPGNVMRLNWEIADLLVVVGRVQDRDGNPIANAVIESVQGLASTDEYGYFQAEIKQAASAEGVLLEFRDSDGLCRVLVPEFEKRAGVGFLDTLVCRRVADPGKER